MKHLDSNLTRIMPFPATSYREVIRVCLPLVLSLSATTIMEFTDRVFLANYSLHAIAAALPAGITSYLFIAFFGGVSGYAGVFIAQYTGRGDHHKVGAVLWQALYFCLGAGLFLFLLGIYGTTLIFTLAGHSAEVQVQEEIYFSLLSKGSVLQLTMVTLSTFFTGRGITRPVMLITIIGVVFNIPLDYALIFGRWGSPELGIKGAAIATVAAWGINVFLLSCLIFTRRHNQQFMAISGWRPDTRLFIRLLRFGIPSGAQFTLDIFGFTLFILLVGKIGDIALAATNVVISINALAFMPSMGVSQGVSVLVGQAIGRNRPDLASTHVKSAANLLLAYILLVDLALLFVPEILLGPFLTTEHGTASLAVAKTSYMLLRIVAAYLFFDALYMVFSGALRGAGDTRFMMLSSIIATPLTIVLPVYFGIVYFQISVVTAWIWVLVFITTLFLLSGYRYWTGKWREIQVIEATTAKMPPP